MPGDDDGMAMETVPAGAASDVDIHRPHDTRAQDGQVVQATVPNANQTADNLTTTAPRRPRGNRTKSKNYKLKLAARRY